MKNNVFFIHWHERENKEMSAPLLVAGFEVDCHWTKLEPTKLKDNLPDILVISLERLPSHGRHVAEWMWDAKKRRHVPIVFVGGDPNKIGYFKNFFPTAYYTEVANLVPTVQTVCEKLIQEEALKQESTS